MSQLTLSWGTVAMFMDALLDFMQDSRFDNSLQDMADQILEVCKKHLDAENVQRQKQGGVPKLPGSESFVSTAGEIVQAFMSVRSTTTVRAREETLELLALYKARLATDLKQMRGNKPRRVLELEKEVASLRAQLRFRAQLGLVRDPDAC